MLRLTGERISGLRSEGMEREGSRPMGTETPPRRMSLKIFDFRSGLPGTCAGLKELNPVEVERVGAVEMGLGFGDKI